MKPNPPDPKRHHTVSEFYLKGFVDSRFWAKEKERLWMYRLGQGPVTISPDNASVVKYFYMYEDQGKKHYEVETALADIEDYAAPIIQKLGTGDFTLSLQEKSELATFLAIMITRVPFFHDATDKIASRLNIELLTNLSSHPKLLERTAEEYERQTGEIFDIESEEFREACEALKTGEITMTQKSRGWTIKQMLVAAMQLSPIVQNMNWILLAAPRDEDFITSDAPVTLFDPVVPRPERQGFELSSKADFIFPVNRQFCLYGRSSPLKNTEAINASAVRTLNKRTIIGAYKSIFASYRSNRLAALASELIGKHKSEVWDNVDAYVSLGKQFEL